jgi:hypothetical protein
VQDADCKAAPGGLGLLIRPQLVQVIDGALHLRGGGEGRAVDVAHADDAVKWQRRFPFRITRCLVPPKIVSYCPLKPISKA